MSSVAHSWIYKLWSLDDWAEVHETRSTNQPERLDLEANVLHVDSVPLTRNYKCPSPGTSISTRLVSYRCSLSVKVYEKNRGNNGVVNTDDFRSR